MTRKIKETAIKLSTIENLQTTKTMTLTIHDSLMVQKLSNLNHWQRVYLYIRKYYILYDFVYSIEYNQQNYSGGCQISKP